MCDLAIVVLIRFRIALKDRAFHLRVEVLDKIRCHHHNEEDADDAPECCVERRLALMRELHWDAEEILVTERLLRFCAASC